MATRDYRSSEESVVEYAHEKERSAVRRANLLTVFLTMTTGVALTMTAYVFLKTNASQSTYTAKLEAALSEEQSKNTQLTKGLGDAAQTIKSLNGDIKDLQDKNTDLNKQLAACKSSQAQAPACKPVQNQGRKASKDDSPSS